MMYDVSPKLHLSSVNFDDDDDDDDDDNDNEEEAGSR